MKKKEDNRLIILGLVTVVALAVVAFAIKEPVKKINYNELAEDEINLVIQENVDTMQKIDLSTYGERDRIEYYVSEFISKVENGEYETAYEMLYDDFKTNYFPTLASFEDYAKKKFSKMMSLEHTNFERNGDVYVLWVTLSNPLSGKNTGKEMNFLVQEYDLNDYKISFSVN